MAFFSPQRAHPAQAPAPVPDPPGAAASSLLKRYRPLETRAAGGFGSVEICLDSRLQRRVAIKRIPLASPHSRTAAEATATALAEARTASMLQHPNIASVIDFTYDSAYAYLVMEYVDGMSLEEFLAQVEGNSLTYDEAACIADSLAQALSFAHENGVLHLDIKPANVLIDRSGHVKLTDFGMAMLTSAAGFGGARGGTIGYMSPEQLRGDMVDERSDIFSLAALLYECLCGDAPFRAGTPIDSMTRINEGVIRPSSLLPDLPEAGERALLTALDPEPSFRMGSVADFGDLFLAGLGSTREGRRSLSRMIERLTSDEDAEPESGDAAPQHPVRELDPAEGRLGSRHPRARDFALGAVSAVSVGSITLGLMSCMGVASPLGRAAAAIAIGAAAGVAPQIGSALACTGLLFMVVNATAPLAVIPAAVGILALACGWWLVWGRTSPAASCALTLAMALSMGAGGPSPIAVIAATIAGYFSSPVPAAVTAPLGILFGSLASSALHAGGALPPQGVLAVLEGIELPVYALGIAALAAAISAVHHLAWNRYQDSGGAGAFALAYVLPLPSALVLLCLAHPMEIATLPTSQIATAAGAGALSSILVWIYAYSLGYKEDPEGDRS